MEGAENSSEKPKTVFEYTDYRAFLRDTYAHLKTTSTKFSFRYFSRVAGFKSPNYLKIVMDGGSNLSEEAIEKFIKGFKLNQEEGSFFRNLVLFNQASTTEEKQHHSRALLRSRQYRKIHPLSEFHFNYFANWYYIPIRELVALKGFREDPEWIGRTLLPQITPVMARKALDELRALGLLTRDEKGRLIQSNTHISTANEVSSAVLAQFHREMMKRASESIDRIPRERREISSLTFGVSEETARKIKERIQEFRRELVELISDDNAATTVYQLNFQLFPFNNPLDDSEEEQK